MSLDDPERTKLCLDRLKEATIVFGQAQIEAGADALTLPDHATGDLVSARLLPPLPARPAHRVRGGARRRRSSCTSAGARSTACRYIAETGMAAFHYDSKNRAGGVAGGRRRRASAWSATSTTRDALRQGPGRGARARCARTSPPASRWSARSARSRCRRRSRTCSRSATRSTRVAPERLSQWPMPSSTTSPTTSCARRSTSSSSARTSAQRLIDAVRRARRTTCLLIAAALIDGDDDTVDELTREALDDGTHGAGGDGRRPDRRDGPRRHQVPRELHLRARGARLRPRDEGRDGAHRADPLGLRHRAASARS